MTTAAPRRRLTAVPPDQRAPEAAPRSPRTRRTVGGSAEELNTTTLSTLAERIYAAKVLADQAANDYEALRKEGLAALVATGRKEHTIAANGDRPAFQMKIASKSINTIDPVKFRDMVEPDEFIQCVTIKATEAKRFIGEARLEKVTTTTEGNPYLDCRVKGKDPK